MEVVKICKNLQIGIKSVINPRKSCSQLQISTRLIAQRSITIRDHKVRLTLFLLRKVLRTLKRFFRLVKELTKHIYLLIEKQPNRDIYFFRFRKFSKSEKNRNIFTRIDSGRFEEILLDFRSNLRSGLSYTRGTALSAFFGISGDL